MKPSSSLKTNPQFHFKKEGPEAPVKTVVDKLSVTDGASLDILTRSDVALARAKEMSYIYEFLYNSAFVRGYVETAQRSAISRNGLAREELISSLEAGGKLPPEYYGTGGKTSDMLYMRDDEE